MRQSKIALWFIGVIGILLLLYWQIIEIETITGHSVRYNSFSSFYRDSTEAIDDIIAHGTQWPLPQQYNAMKNLNNHLNEEQKQKIYDYLVDYRMDDSAIKIKRQFIDILLEQEVFPKELVDILITIAEDKYTTIYIRSYALIYLKLIYEEYNSNPQIKEIFIHALDDKSDVISALALRMMISWREKFTEYERISMRTKALNIVYDNNAWIGNRIAAIHFLIKWDDDKNDIEVYKHIITSVNCAIIKLYALQALTETRDRTQIPFLKTLEHCSDPIGDAARNAILKLI